MQSHRAAQSRIADDNGDWRKVSWDKYTLAASLASPDLH